MKLWKECQTFLLYLGTIFHPSTLIDSSDVQQALSFEVHDDSYGHPPNFRAPGGPEDGKFVCQYPDLGNQWTDCSTPENRGCWLKGPNGEEFNLTTDYENIYPKGIVRNYYIEVDDTPINADGIINPDGKVFNNTYPGPWIEACWGDILNITVKNNLRWNGTTIHWHGIRQLNSMEMDGVNAVTQCPIAPGDTYTYTFRATQYGTTWYHSHYSLQYADGVAGPMTIHGPSSDNYDEARDPILITDWNHRSAFQDFQHELDGTGPPRMNSVLLNGIGNFAGASPRNEKFTFKSIKKGNKYLLRIINTSVDTTYIFSIDNHNFTVLTTDFVPIHPYNVSHILVGIGQRYHVVLYANPIDNGQLSNTGDYWIRAVPADGCQGFETGNDPDERQGILRYNSSSEAIPTSKREGFSLKCRDEEYSRLHPIHPWSVEPMDFDPEGFDVGLQAAPHKPQLSDNFTRWTMGDVPLWLNFSDPTILNLNNKTWNPDYVVIPEDMPENAWIYLLITADDMDNKWLNRTFVAVAHPLHLHGHDFALLAQSSEPYNKSTAVIKYDNPPRRDVALLPQGGYLLIAFKADNPGAWLIHCHIAWHASSGLAMQILERQGAIAKSMTPKRLEATNRGCKNWDTWFGNSSNHWNKYDVKAFQDDSGI
ncbi:hypothetical protein B7494_g5097 [Chlorociboria aeruginascens]|nr:hypothetical protein B7494_g5097 [Chlorociboria aeruginascens]